MTMKTSFKLIISGKKTAQGVKFLFRTMILLFGMQFLAGCSDFFSVREAETPNGGTASAYAKTPAEVITLFEKSLKENRPSLYAGLLSDSLLTGREYSFTSEAGDVASGSSAPPPRSDDKQFADSALNNSHITGDVIPEPFDEPQQDTILIKFSYNLQLTDQNSLQTRLKGNSSFTLIKKNSIWYIAHWFDYHAQLNTEISFSKLKLNLTY